MRDTIVRLGLLEVVDEGRLYASIEEGVDAFRQEAPG